MFLAQMVDFRPEDKLIGILLNQARLGKDDTAFPDLLRSSPIILSSYKDLWQGTIAKIGSSWYFYLRHPDQNRAVIPGDSWIFSS